MGLDSSALTAADTFTTNLYPPLSGTPVLAADVASGEQVLLNRTEYLYNRRFNSADSIQVDGEGGGAYSQNFNTTSYVVDSSLDLTLTGVAVGDWVEFNVNGYATLTGAGIGRIGIFVEYDGVFSALLTNYLVKATGPFAFGFGLFLPAPVGTWTSGILNLNFAGQADSGSSILVEGVINFAAKQFAR